jgi:hypothetical protein
MSRVNSTKLVDEDVQAVLDVLQAYKADHPKAKIEAYRRNNVSIRIRIVDPSFARMDLVERDNQVWQYIERLSEDVQSQITMLVLVTPAETKTSLANLEYEHPSPSLL